MKHRRLKREHGRILSVETKVRGDVLLEAAAAGATQLVVGDAGDFDETGGWLSINDQVVKYLEVDDDEGLITLATGLTAAADSGDQVALWSTLYEEIVDYQEAEVVLDGEHDNPEAIVAEVAEGVGDLPEGDRGEAGESCTLLRVSDDEWEIVGVGGRSRKSRSIRFEADDTYVLTAADLTAGTATVLLSHQPINESLIAFWNGVPQRPTNYTINYDAQTITWPLDGFEEAGDRLWVHYAYRRGIATPKVTPRILFHWKLDETSGATWADSGPDALTMDVVGAPTLGQPPAPGIPGYSASFNGTDAAGRAETLTGGTALDGLAEVSWGFSVKSSKTTGYQGIVTRQMLNHSPVVSDVHWSIGIAPGGVLHMDLFYDDGTNVTLDSPAPIADGEWHRCWLALGSGTLTMYVDGTPVAEAAWAHPTRSGYEKSIILGAYSLFEDPDIHWLAGSLDDVKIVASKVTASEAGSL